MVFVSASAFWLSWRTDGDIDPSHPYWQKLFLCYGAAGCGWAAPAGCCSSGSCSRSVLLCCLASWCAAGHDVAGNVYSIIGYLTGCSFCPSEHQLAIEPATGLAVVVVRRGNGHPRLSARPAGGDRERLRMKLSYEAVARMHEQHAYPPGTRLKREEEKTPIRIPATN